MSGESGNTTSENVNKAREIVRKLADRSEAEPEYPLVRIVWLDSAFREGWHTGEATTEPIKCVSVGFLIHDGESAKVIVGNITEEDEPQRCGEMTIPVVAILQLDHVDLPGG